MRNDYSWNGKVLLEETWNILWKQAMKSVKGYLLTNKLIKPVHMRDVILWNEKRPQYSYFIPKNINQKPSTMRFDEYHRLPKPVNAIQWKGFNGSDFLPLGGISLNEDTGTLRLISNHEIAYRTIKLKEWLVFEAPGPDTFSNFRTMTDEDFQAEYYLNWKSRLSNRDTQNVTKSDVPPRGENPNVVTRLDGLMGGVAGPVHDGRAGQEGQMIR